MRALALVAAIALVGCGSGSGTDADDLVLRQGDLPGWEAEPHDVSRDNYGQVGQDFDDCIGVDHQELDDDAPRASSPDFEQDGGARQVQQTVLRTGSAAQAEAIVGNFLQPRSAECMSRVHRQLVPDDTRGITLDDVETEPLEVDDGAGLRTTLHLRIGTTPITVYTDNVFIADGPWWARFTFIGTGKPLDAGIQDRLLDLTRRRLADA